LLVQYINGLGMRLVAHANSVKTPFHFYLINNDEINAFAFFGGNVVLHSALFRYSITKASWPRSWRTKFPTSPSAIWRVRWKTRNVTPPDLGGRTGFHSAGDGQPAGRDGGADRYAGRYAQGMISFTQQNEQEADRIGIQVCSARL
jgi:predicted Zn-dependent protease